MRRKRYGPVGSQYNSRKYLRMHNMNISEGLKRYHRHKRGEYTDEELRVNGFIVLVLIIGFIFLMIYTSGK